MNDFAVISLSDLLTPWDIIKSRVECAARADFVLVLYNPRSKTRVIQIEIVRDILLNYRKPGVPVCIVRKMGTSEEKVCITTLKDMLNYTIDMETVIIVGNSRTYVFGDYMVTPRGYETKLD